MAARHQLPVERLRRAVLALVEEPLP
jgi:hypothetical protein